MTRALTITEAQLDGAPVSLRAVDGRFVAIGPEVAPEPGDEVLPASGMHVLPGLVNGHTHAAMTLLRGFGDDLPLMEWLERRIWPAERAVTEDDVYWGTRLACIEMIRSGTVRFWDMYWHQHRVAEAVVDSGMRAVVGQPIMEFDGAPSDTRPEQAAAGITHLAKLGSRVEGALAPHAVYTVSERSLRHIAEVAADLAVPVHTHLSETEGEVIDCAREHGLRPPAYLDEVGLLNERAVLAHGVYLDDDELALIADRGATIVTNPVSNMKLAVGRAFRAPAALRAGVPVGLGTDGAASNNSLDLFADMKVLALLQKHAHADASVMPAEETWAIATGARAPRLGGTAVEVGAPADCILVPSDTTELTPGPLVDDLVYAAAGSIVQTVVIDGEVVMRDRAIDGEADVRARVREIAERVARTAG